MADEYMHIESNSHEVVGKLYVAEASAHRKLLDLLEDATKDAESWLRLYTPKWSGYTLRHIDHTKATWQPGGAGGGGDWVSVAGVKRGDSIHPIYALMGTGIYVGRGLIVPKVWGVRPESPAAFWQMFRKEGSGRFTMGGRSGKREARLVYRTRSGGLKHSFFVRGQKPKPFLYLTFQSTQLYVRARVMTFGHDLF